ALDVAVVQGNELLSTHVYELGGDEEMHVAQMQRACRQLTELAGGPCAIVLEKPWMVVGKGLKSAQTLHEIPTAFRALAIAHGHTVEYVAVATWRAQLLGNGRLKTEAAKAFALRFVKL